MKLLINTLYMLNIPLSNARCFLCMLNGESLGVSLKRCLCLIEFLLKFFLLCLYTRFSFLVFLPFCMNVIHFDLVTNIKGKYCYKMENEHNHVTVFVASDLHKKMHHLSNNLIISLATLHRL